MTLRVGVIGTGWAHRVQIPAFRAVGLEIVGIAGRDQAKTAQVAAAHGIAFHTTAWRDLLELDCQLVSLTSPPKLHREQAIAVLEAGKHLLCEKPLAMDEVEAAAMCQVAERYPEQLALVDHQLRFLPARRKAKELIDSGVIGRILMVTVRITSGSRMNPREPFSWWSDAAQGGGILGAIGSHALDGIRWLLEPHCGPIEITGAALGQTYPTRLDANGQERKVTADDIASLAFRMGEVVGTLLVHGAALDEAVDLLTIRGERGTLVIDKSLKLYLGKRRGPLKEYVTRLPGLVPNRFRASPFAAGTVLLGHALSEALGSQRELSALSPAARLADGLVVQRLLDEARRIAR